MPPTTSLAEGRVRLVIFGQHSQVKTPLGAVDQPTLQSSTLPTATLPSSTAEFADTANGWKRQRFQRL